MVKSFTRSQLSKPIKNKQKQKMIKKPFIEKKGSQKFTRKTATKEQKDQDQSYNIKDCEEFKKNYEQFIEFMNKKQKFDDKEKKFFYENYKILNDIFIQVKQLKGFYEVCNEKKWSQIQRTPEQWDLKNIYEKFLFKFDVYQRSFLDDQFVDQNMKQKIHLIDISKFEELPLFTKEQYPIHQDLINKVDKEQCCVIRGFTNQINNDLFSIDMIDKLHGKQMVDIRVQNPKVYTFSTNSLKDQQKQRYLPVSSYVKYQKKFGDNKNAQNNIFFGVNIDIENWQEHKQEIQKIQKEFTYLTEYDFHKYLRHHILGVTQPQIYLKVKGSWTGGHQENLRVKAININHGPGESLWYTVDNKHVSKFRKIVMDKYKQDIHKIEGLWFCDPEFVMMHGIPIKAFYQKPGDIVILGPGCLHWVRSDGVAVNSAWNVCDNQIELIQEIHNRFEINKQINFISILPVKTLFMDILNHEQKVMKPETINFLKQKLGEFQMQEEQEFQKLTKKERDLFLQEPEESNILNCSLCQGEIFNYWVMCTQCDENYLFYCLWCQQKHKKACKDQKTIEHYYKYKSKDINELISKNCDSKHQCQVQSLCRPDLYIGNPCVACNIKQEQKTLLQEVQNKKSVSKQKKIKVIDKKLSKSQLKKMQNEKENVMVEAVTILEIQNQQKEECEIIQENNIESTTPSKQSKKDSGSKNDLYSSSKKREIDEMINQDSFDPLSFLIAEGKTQAEQLKQVQQELQNSKNNNDKSKFVSAHGRKFNQALREYRIKFLKELTEQNQEEKSKQQIIDNLFESIQQDQQNKTDIVQQEQEKNIHQENLNSNIQINKKTKKSKESLRIDHPVENNQINSDLDIISKENSNQKQKNDIDKNKKDDHVKDQENKQQLVKNDDKDVGNCLKTSKKTPKKDEKKKDDAIKNYQSNQLIDSNYLNGNQIEKESQRKLRNNQIKQQNSQMIHKSDNEKQNKSIQDEQSQILQTSQKDEDKESKRKLRNNQIKQQNSQIILKSDNEKQNKSIQDEQSYIIQTNQLDEASNIQKIKQKFDEKQDKLKQISLQKYQQQDEKIVSTSLIQQISPKISQQNSPKIKSEKSSKTKASKQSMQECRIDSKQNSPRIKSEKSSKTKASKLSMQQYRIDSKQDSPKIKSEKSSKTKASKLSMEECRIDSKQNSPKIKSQKSSKTKELILSMEECRIDSKQNSPKMKSEISSQTNNTKLIIEEKDINEEDLNKQCQNLQVQMEDPLFKSDERIIKKIKKQKQKDFQLNDEKLFEFDKKISKKVKLDLQQEIQPNKIILQDQSQIQINSPQILIQSQQNNNSTLRIEEKIFSDKLLQPNNIQEQFDKQQNITLEQVQKKFDDQRLLKSQIKKDSNYNQMIVQTAEILLSQMNLEQQEQLILQMKFLKNQQQQQQLHHQFMYNDINKQQQSIEYDYTNKQQISFDKQQKKQQIINKQDEYEKIDKKQGKKTPQTFEKEKINSSGKKQNQSSGKKLQIQGKKSPLQQMGKKSPGDSLLEKKNEYLGKRSPAVTQLKRYEETFQKESSNDYFLENILPCINNATILDEKNKEELIKKIKMCKDKPNQNQEVRQILKDFLLVKK